MYFPGPAVAECAWSADEAVAFVVAGVAGAGIFEREAPPEPVVAVNSVAWALQGCSGLIPASQEPAADVEAVARWVG